MPKVVDNYVFERKIGSGQYGDVFKGYNKNNMQDIAIKAIKRESIKGISHSYCREIHGTALKLNKSVEDL
jgi:serine/threonine protein kinase